MLVEALLLIAADPAAIRCGDASLADAVGGYADRIKAMDTKGIAELYGADGQSVMGGKTLTGSAEIGAFLGQFAGFHVTESTMTIADAREDGTGWRTEGRFTQVGTTPDGTAYQTHGRFVADWTCDSARHWRVRRMETASE